MSDNVKPNDLERKALCSYPATLRHQVRHNRESRALKYAMRDRRAGFL
jgi:hypothetical protein